MMQRTGEAKICKGCWQQMHLPIPLRGPLSLPFRMVGIRPSQMNPNLCTICELMFERVMKRRAIEIDATILFADIRGYTTLAQAMEPTELSRLLNFFYDECAGAIWREDGLLNKVIGDAVLAIFHFPIRHADHARKALARARRDMPTNRARRWPWPAISRRDGRKDAGASSPGTDWTPPSSGSGSASTAA